MSTPPTRGMAMKQPEADPSPDEIASALAALEEHTTTTPPVRHIRTLARAGITPSINVGHLSILGWSITEGSPRHGAMRSDDHVSFWETRFTSRESCPDCDSYERTFTYSSHHNIAGHLVEQCDYCEHTFESEDWG